jgi:hypothetical protein
MLGSHKPGAEWCREPGTAGGYIVTTDPAAIDERVQQRHADVVRPIAETDYGAREFAVRDPEAICGHSATTRAHRCRPRCRPYTEESACTPRKSSPTCG